MNQWVWWCAHRLRIARARAHFTAWMDNLFYEYLKAGDNNAP